MILVVYGTRPESIKISPVVRALRRRGVDVLVLSTGQHEIGGHPELRPDRNLGVMRPSQRLNDLAGRVLFGIEDAIVEYSPDWLLVQGDTTSAAIACLAAFHRGVKIAHIEAGLRTYDLRSPFPEEMNRRLIDSMADLLFAPTTRAAGNLIAEPVTGAVHTTGNPGIDSLLDAAADMPVEPPTREVLVTVHRRESFGAPLGRIIGAIRESAARWPDLRFIVPVHPNPNVSVPMHIGLEDTNVTLVPPLGYLELVRLLRRCYFVVTDSGGLQEEAPVFGKPVLVVRDRTERTEGIDEGVARLVGTDAGRIIDSIGELRDPEAYRSMARPVLLYGDGRAGERIADIIARAIDS